MRCFCAAGNANYTIPCGPVMAIVTAKIGNHLPVCARCLDEWFDNADDWGSLHEPAEVRFLDGRVLA